jgi:3-keto-L-gulonate-6-phosphate decarboxylase
MALLTSELQVAVDTPDIDVGLKQIRLLSDAEVDVIEIGTPLITSTGMTSIRSVRALLPNTILYADLKLLDFPDIELREAFAAGANRCSALISLSNENLQRSLEIASRWHGTVILSTMGYPVSLLRERVDTISRIGEFDFIAHGCGVSPHEAFSDMQSRLSILGSVLPPSRIIAAGGISTENIDSVVASGIRRVIVGRGVLASVDPTAQIEILKTRLLLSSNASVT